VYIYRLRSHSLSPLQLVHSQPSSRFPTHIALFTTILLLQSLLNSSPICPAFVDITAFVNITAFALPTSIRCHQSVDSSSDEYEPTDTGTEYHSGSETELTGVGDDVDEVNVADKVDEYN
jgi:hypothetical protein